MVHALLLTLAASWSGMPGTMWSSELVRLDSAEH